MKRRPLNQKEKPNEKGPRASTRVFKALRQIAVDWPVGLPKPPKDPATLDDFLRLVVKAKTPADSMARLRQFLLQRGPRPPFWVPDIPPSKADCDSWAISQIEQMKQGDKQGGYFTRHVWLGLGSAYRYWWKAQKSIKARESANKRKPSR